MSSVGLRGAIRGGQALIETPIEANGTQEDYGGVLFHDSIGLMCQLHCNRSHQRPCAYYWYCQ